MEGTVERAAMSAVREREHRRDGQGRVQRAKRPGPGDAQRDGQSHGRAGRLPGGVLGRTTRRRLRVPAGRQGIALHVADEPNVTYTVPVISSPFIFSYDGPCTTAFTGG